MIRARATRSCLGWKKKIPPPLLTLNSCSINMGCQHEDGQTAATKKKREKYFSRSAACYLHMWHADKPVSKMRKQSGGETRRLADPTTRRFRKECRYHSNQQPSLVFRAASRITAKDLMFSTHLGSANMGATISHSVCLQHTTLQNLLFGTQQQASAPPEIKSCHVVPD